MIKLSPTSWFAVALVALLQTAALAQMVYGRTTLLRDGREIVADVIPVDPRDLFRGDYVILGYAFGAAQVPVHETTRRGDTVYVTLKPTAPGQWEVVTVDGDYPSLSGGPDNIVLKGIADYVYRNVNEPAKASISYGIESYFVPEGTGLELEKQVREKKISAVLAVDGGGNVAIKALIIDGKRLAEQPWF